MPGGKRIEIAPSAIAPSLALAIMQTGAAISLAALVFADSASSHLPSGTTSFLVGSAIISVVLAWQSSFPIMVGSARNSITVVIAAVAASVASGSPEHPGETVAVFVVVAAMSSGLLLYLTGRFGLGHVVRFMPFPVMGGYIAGTAWLMVKGGFQVMTDSKLTFASLDTFFTWPVAQFWLPGVALALLIVLLPGSTKQSMSVVAALAGFHIVARIVSSPSEVQANGWVIGPLEDPGGISLIQPSDFSSANWGEIAAAVPGLAAIALITIVAALLNITGVEFATTEDVDIDIDKELRASGAASAISGAVGGPIGFVAIGSTLLARQLRASSQLITAAFVVFVTFTVVAGPGLIGWMPRLVAGGMIMGPGLGMFRKWFRDSLRRGPVTDRAIALLIPLAVGFFGVLEAVGLGILVAATLFIWRYSSIDPIRTQISARQMRSTVDRTTAETALLRTHGEKIAVLRLEGYLFFGTAARIGERVTALLAGSPGLEHLILDFQRVSGIDTSAQAELTKIMRRCTANNTALMFSRLPEDVAAWIDETDMAELAVLDVDHALARAETLVIESSGGKDHLPAEPTLSDEELACFTRHSVAAGTALFATGRRSTALTLIESGTFSVWADGAGAPTRLRQIGPGSFLGEVSFFTGSAATATVTADTDCIVLQLPLTEFEKLSTNQPRLALRLTKHVLAKTATRLTTTNSTVIGQNL